jgi:AAA+ superfamily predicted ATPase
MENEETYITPEPILVGSEKKNKNSYTCWINETNGEFIPSIKTTELIEPGKYKIKWNNKYGKYGFAKQTLKLDELLYLPNNTFKEILSDIEYFWDNKDLFLAYGFNYKRGILLYGEPGCGKSSIIALLSDQVIKRGGIVISIQNYDDLENYSREFSGSFRTIQPDTPSLVIFEDLDSLILNNDAETLLLNILDGIDQCDNIVNIGCTNYPEKLEDRILNRPSRFDRRYYLGLPDSKVRSFYFENKIREKDIETRGGEAFLKELVQKTEGLTLAHLGELVKSVFIFKNDLSETIELLKGMKKQISSSSFGNKEGLGL